jgi:hypothetical protein
MGERLKVELSDRDWDLLRDLFESRVMTLRHVARLYFPGLKDMPKKRVQKLKAAGLVAERERTHVSQPSVLQLTKKAYEVLRKKRKLEEYPQIGFENRGKLSELKLKHELEVMDVKAALKPAIDGTERFEVVQFSTWPFLYEFKACDPRGMLVPTQPDAFIRVHETLLEGGVEEHYFFLEVDRSEEGQLVLAERAHCYGDFYRNGGFAARFGGTIETKKDYGFRVLITCKTEERRNNLAERLLLNTPPVHSQVWITTTAQLTENPLGPIWIRPVDYRDVTKDTPFDPYKERERIYRRQTEREDLVDRLIPKYALFGPDEAPPAPA